MRSILGLFELPVVRITTLVLLPVIGGFTIDFLLRDKAAVDALLPAILGVIGGVLIDLLITLNWLLDKLQRRYTLLPGDQDGGRISRDNVLAIMDALSEMPDPSGDPTLDPFVANVLQGSVVNEIRELADPETKGEARYSSQRLRSLTEALEKHMGRNHEIWATCFTSMDEFWGKKNIGADYLEFNLKLIVDRQVAMRRIFGLEGSAAYGSDGLKTELIRILGDYERSGPLHPVEVLVFDMSKHGAMLTKDRDLFLIVEASPGQDPKDAKPLLALRWDLDGDQLKQIVVVYDSTHLRSLRDYYLQLWDKSENVDWPKIGKAETHQRTVRRAKEYWERSIEYASSNQRSYLSDLAASADTDQVVTYWNNLDGSLIRPAQDGLEQLHRRLEALAGEPKPPRNVLSLGCTPETRAAIAYALGDVRVDCADISALMYPAMNAFVARARWEQLKLPKGKDDPKRLEIVSRLVQEQAHRPYDWNSLDLREAKYDLIVGVDAINMLPHAAMTAFLASLRKSLQPRGRVYMQAVVKPEGALRSELVPLRGNERLGLAYVAIADAAADSRLSDGDAFSRLLLSTVVNKGQPDPVVHVGSLLREIRLIEETRTDARQEVRGFYEKFRYCNSALALRSRLEFETLFRQQFALEHQPYWNDAADYSGAFCWYWLVAR